MIASGRRFSAEFEREIHEVVIITKAEGAIQTLRRHIIFAGHDRHAINARRFGQFLGMVDQSVSNQLPARLFGDIDAFWPQNSRA